MRLHRLTVTAFGPFGGTQRIDFDELSAAGLFLLHGPTGAGKTSVLDAVCYALYGGVPGARQSGLTLRSDHASPDTPTEVLLELTAGGRRLEITRRPEQRRPKKRGSGFTRDKAQSWLREYAAPTGDPRFGEPPEADAEALAPAIPHPRTPHEPHRSGGGGWKALSRSHQEIGEEIALLLGMSKEQFCQVVLLPQGDFARFLRADDQARGKLLGRLFDTGRFAAVEDRLADLRRAAEAQVRAGDERLLALAHRMAQAAGSGADPLPEIPAGEPGLADAVLGWAAVARSAARELRDIALTTAAAAESAHAATQRGFDAARELDRLQCGHAAAEQRAAALDAGRAEQDRARLRLDRARAAASVAPALDLRESAERQHLAAAVAERAGREQLGRAGLPAATAGAGGDELAALENASREELGGLAAARRAEQRAERITAERAALDREARSDDELSQDAADWLTEWDTTRDAHQRRVEAAQEAATRAEQLAVRIDPAVRRHEAAQRRDALTSQVGEARTRLLRAGEQAVGVLPRLLGPLGSRQRGFLRRPVDVAGGGAGGFGVLSRAAHRARCALGQPR
ncbi:SMC family ATPase, partial [Streptomyces sp. H27-D2]|uniref:SMC family ATPase n=1 Tax=Streptomyces sp. H27-D2 TaxID=3046304 RepID=UPI002DC0360F